MLSACGHHDAAMRPHTTAARGEAQRSGSWMRPPPSACRLAAHSAASWARSMVRALPEPICSPATVTCQAHTSGPRQITASSQPCARATTCRVIQAVLFGTVSVPLRPSVLYHSAGRAASTGLDHLACRRTAHCGRPLSFTAIYERARSLWRVGLLAAVPLLASTLGKRLPAINILRRFHNWKDGRALAKRGTLCQLREP